MFRVEVKMKNEVVQKTFEEIDDAFVEIDRAVHFAEVPAKMVALYQDDRFVRGYINGEEITPRTNSIYV